MTLIDQSQVSVPKSVLPRKFTQISIKPLPEIQQRNIPSPKYSPTSYPITPGIQQIGVPMGSSIMQLPVYQKPSSIVPLQSQIIATNPIQNKFNILRRIDMNRVSTVRSSKSTNYYSLVELRGFMKELGEKPPTSKKEIVEVLRRIHDNFMRMHMQ